jgi:hypothetical protein
MADQPRSPSTSSPNSGGPNYQGATAKQLVEDAIKAAAKDHPRLLRNKQDWLNLLGYRGGPDNWWVQWVNDAWVTIPEDGDDGLPAEIPRQASNYYARKINGIAAILNQADPAQEWRPAKDDDQARATADVIEDALPVLREEADYPRLRNLINLLVALTDKVALELYYDNDEKYGTEDIGALRCNACQKPLMPMDLADQDAEEGQATCPHCGGPEVSDDPMQGIGPYLQPDGSPVGVPYPKGKICADLYTSFEFSLPPNAVEAHERRVEWILTHRAMPREVAMRRWKDKAAFIKQAKGETSITQGATGQYATAMRNLSSPRSATFQSMGGAIDTVIVYRLVHDPITDKDEGIDFPEGADLTMIDGEIVEGGPLALKDDLGQPMKPFAIRSFIQAPGSPFGIPPADDLGVLQRQRNLLETLLILILMHDAAPRTYIPLTVTLEDEITGRPGEQIRYRANMPGDKPHTDPGINPPEGLYKALEMNSQAFDTVSGLNAVLEGEHPEGASTLGEVTRLSERGMAAFKAPLDALVDFEERISYLLLQIGRQSLWASRLVKTIGENGDWELKEFMAADLHGSVDVYTNPASAWPKSQLLQNMRLEAALKMGALQMQDPEVQANILSDFDLVHLKPSLDKDRRQIARELDKWKQAQTPQDIKPPSPFINVDMHLFQKSNWMKTEEAEQIETANPPVWGAMNTHIQQLQQQVTAKQQAAAQAASGKAAPQPKPAEPQDELDRFSLKGDLTDPEVRQLFEQAAAKDGYHITSTPAPAEPNPNAGPDGTALDAAIKHRALIPAHGSPMDHFVKAGALRPAPPPPPVLPGAPPNGNGQPPAGPPAGPPA